MSAGSYGQDISNELQNKITVNLVAPQHDRSFNQTRRTRTDDQNCQANIQRARIAQQTILQTAVTARDSEAPMKLALLQNEIAQGTFTANMDVPVEMTDLKKTEFNEFRTFRERKANLIKHRGRHSHRIQGQCTKMLQDKTSRIPINPVSTSDPLTLYRLIEKTVLHKRKTSIRLPPSTTRNSRSTLQQENLSNPQWYERFNTKVDVETRSA
jgi:hypothetical protein